MPQITTVTTICDGDGMEILPDTTPLTLRDDQGNTIYLHNYDCLSGYGDRKKQERAEKVAAAENDLRIIQGGF